MPLECVLETVQELRLVLFALPALSRDARWNGLAHVINNGMEAALTKN